MESIRSLESPVLTCWCGGRLAARAFIYAKCHDLDGVSDVR